MSIFPTVGKQLFDILLPDMDGFSFLEELQKMRKKIPVIMITGYSTAENAVKSIYKGAINFIPKPFTFEELKSSIVRGLQFNILQNKIQNSETDKVNKDVTFVPCPPKYFRFGNISWMNLESEGVACLGVTNLFLETIIELTEIELMEVDESLVQGTTCANFVNFLLVFFFLMPFL